LPGLRCLTREHAKDFKCEFSPNTCDCRQADDSRMNCRCEQINMAKAFTQIERLLPLQTAGFFFTTSLNRVTTSLEKISAVQVQVTLNDLKVASSNDNNVCTATVEEFAGCYRCLSGAQLKLRCSTNFGSAMALISCDDNQFTANCDVTGLHSISTLAFATSIIKADCRVRCPGGDSRFQLDGTLAFIANEDVRSVDNVAVHSVQTNSSFFSAITGGLGAYYGFFMGLLANWEKYVFYLVAVVLIILFTIFCGPSCITGLCSLWRARKFARFLFSGRKK
jgi:hypothetical protein